jgi:hypothetical protein
MTNAHRDCPELGSGIVGRVVAQRIFFDPPSLRVGKLTQQDRMAAFC